jgi:hypothetical protein
LDGDRVDVDSLGVDPGVVLGDVDGKLFVLVEVGVGIVAKLEGDVVSDGVGELIKNDCQSEK